MTEILPQSGNWYKVNLHTHSDLSDGNFSPMELKKLYMAEGYDAVAFTDHRKCIPHIELTDETFVALTGTELDFSQTDANGKLIKAVHLLLHISGYSFGIPRVVKLGLRLIGLNRKRGKSGFKRKNMAAAKKVT